MRGEGKACCVHFCGVLLLIAGITHRFWPILASFFVGRGIGREAEGFESVGRRGGGGVGKGRKSWPLMCCDVFAGSLFSLTSSSPFLFCFVWKEGRGC